MKRTFLFLLIATAIIYAKRGYEQVLGNEQVSTPLSGGSLSDIADEVTAIPLQTTGKLNLKKIKHVRKEGNDLFLLSKGTLYHFNNKGEFICRITDPEVIQVAGYVVNPLNRQVIVLGNTDDIHYYSYQGRLLETKKLKSDLQEYRISSISLYQNHIWTTEESLKADSSNQISYLEKQVVKYDTSFRKVNSHKLVHADTGRKDHGLSYLPPALSVAKDTETIYAYRPSLEPEKLLRDTLFVKEQKENGKQTHCTDDILLYPVRLGSRFWISSYDNKSDQSKSYTFCYDTRNHHAWQVQGGLTDNFYHTGNIPELEAMDLYNQSYCFCKSGEELNKTFPELANGERAVLFIVKLKA